MNNTLRVANKRSYRLRYLRTFKSAKCDAKCGEQSEVKQTTRLVLVEAELNKRKRAVVIGANCNKQSEF